MDDKILKALKDTSLYDKLKRIRSIYQKLEKNQQKFCGIFDIHCSDECDGTCCRHFTPDITENEALFLAYGLIKEGKDDLTLELMRVREQTDEYCPLFIEDSEFHCSVYKWRPLICRLFGASAVSDKTGQPVFRKCKWNPDGKDLSPEAFDAHKSMIILMQDYQMMIDEVDSPDSTRFLITEILPKAIEKIKLVLEYEQEAKLNQ